MTSDICNVTYILLIAFFLVKHGDRSDNENLDLLDFQLKLCTKEIQQAAQRKGY